MIEKLKEVIKKVMPEVVLDGVNENTNLTDDLQFDSLGIMMLAMAIEEEFDIKFEGPIHLVTVGDVIKYIENQKNK